MTDTTRPREAVVNSRGVTPTPDVTPLESHRPGTRNYSTGPAGNDNAMCRPLGYRVKALTFTNPGSNYKSVNSGSGNTDSIYIDVEDINLPNQGGVYATPSQTNAPYELPVGTTLTLEELDPGWIHFASPTANQALMVAWGGPSNTGK